MSIKVRTRSILTLPKRLSIIEDLPNDLVEEKARKCPPPQRVTHLNDAMCERPSHCVIDVLSQQRYAKNINKTTLSRDFSLSMFC